MALCLRWLAEWDNFNLRLPDIRREQTVHPKPPLETTFFGATCVEAPYF